ncbi:MAG: ATP-binding cassette domain-containing protein, partial [Clostridiales bacterium]|nr:ATP-binding cassette domain-containing protein [Clostridiales bacterium]
MSDYCMQVKGLKKYYSFRNKGMLKAVDGVDMSVCRGSLVGVVGESGCGKSTLGKCMMRLVDITEGQVIFEGKDISRQPRKSILTQLRGMQMIFQNPYSSFNPKLKLSYSITEPCRLYGMDRQKTDARVDKLLSHVSLTRRELNRFP